MRQYRNKPKHALYGVTAGAASLVTSVASGFEGLAVSTITPLSVIGTLLRFHWNRRNLSRELNLEELQVS
jgi:uncharacterized membrane protein YbhN (UPF0104 family)